MHVCYGQLNVDSVGYSSILFPITAVYAECPRERIFSNAEAIAMGCELTFFETF